MIGISLADERPMTATLRFFKNNFSQRRQKKLRLDQIAALTFHLFLQEGGPEGKEREIWVRAEKMLREKLSQQNPTRIMTPVAPRPVRAEA